MERATLSMKAFHGSQTPKSSKLGDRDTYFSSNLRSHEPINSQKHLSLGPGRCGSPDISTSYSELSIFDAQKYFNEPSNDDIQKVNISSNNNNRVSPVVHVNAEHNSNKDDIIETSSYSSVTPRATSEASCNSQNGLSSDPSVATAISMKSPHHPAGPSKKARASCSFSKAMWFFRSKCPCSGRKSVQVMEKTTKPKYQIPQTPPPCLSHNQIPRDPLNLRRQELHTNPNTAAENLTVNMETATNKSEPNKIAIKSNQDQKIYVTNTNCHGFQPAENQAPAILQPQLVLASLITPSAEGFSFPVLNSQSSTCSVKMEVANGVNEDPHLDSLKVFQPPAAESTSVYPKFIVRNIHNFAYPVSPKSKTIDEDAGSDASSDLFEIESFSTQTAYAYSKKDRRRDSMDEASNLGPND